MGRGGLWGSRKKRKKKTPGSPCATGHLLTDDERSYSLVATVENVAVRLVPTVPNTVTAATAINAAIRPYSIAVAPILILQELGQSRKHRGDSNKVNPAQGTRNPFLKCLNHVRARGAKFRLSRHRAVAEYTRRHADRKVRIPTRIAP
jgi:hypothetical protein